MYPLDYNDIHALNFRIHLFGCMCVCVWKRGRGGGGGGVGVSGVPGKAGCVTEGTSKCANGSCFFLVLKPG